MSDYLAVGHVIYQPVLLGSEVGVLGFYYVSYLLAVLARVFLIGWVR